MVSQKKTVAVVMGSDSDMAVMSLASSLLYVFFRLIERRR